jgi:hypothetical protein
MRKRFGLFLAVLGLIAAPAPARPAEDQAEALTLIVRVRSIDGLLDDFQYLANLAGREEQAKQIDGLIKGRIGEQGLDGIDTKRPFGLYGTINPGLMDSNAVVLVPVANEKAILSLLENFNVKAKRGDDDIYTVSRDNLPVPIFFRFANRYAYITVQDKSSLAKDKLLPPATVLPPGQTGTVSAIFRIDQIPDALKQIALGQMELRLADVQDRKDGESEAEHQLKVETSKEVARQISSLFREGGALTLRVDVDRKAEQLVAELGLTGKPDSKLATRIADLAQTKSLFGSLVSKDSAMNLAVHLALPTEIRKVLGPMLEEGFRKGLEHEQDQAKREQAARLFKAIKPSLEAGELDLAFDLRGPTSNNTYTVVGGLKIRDGAEIEKAIRALVKDLPAKERGAIHLDSDSAGPVKIHRIDAQKELDEETRRVLGDNPIYFAVRPNTIFLAGGAGGLNALKGALTTQAKAAPPVQFEMSLAQLAPLMEKDSKGSLKAAEEAFGKGKEADKIRFTVQGGKALSVRFHLDAPVVRFISLREKAEK